MKVGETIRKFRKEKGDGLKEFAGKMGYSASYLSNIERDAVKPGRDFIIKLFEIYGLPIDLYESEEEQKKYLIDKEAEVKKEILPTSTKKLLNNVKEILESENQAMIKALKVNIKAFLESVRSPPKNNKDKSTGDD